jgi:3',5'-cyclic AMP phosphodiesterase CpdA
MRLRTQQSLIAAFALALAACGVGSTAPALEMGPAINSAGLQAQQLALPKRPDSVRMGVIGDSGTGDANQYRVAEQLAGFHKLFPYEFVIMLGDNTYGGETARDWELRFERPYKPLLDAGVKFYAAIGNHDTPNQRLYKPFNMGGERFYSFKPKAGVRLFALDSNYMSPEQLQWLEKELAASGSEWKICFFHHPLYSSGGRHGSDTALRDQLEPLFVKYGVDVVLTGHDHFYERIKPQKGIHHFVVGGSAKLRRGDIEKTDLTAKGFDQGYSFMAVEITGDEFHYQAISDLGKTIDSGVIKRQPKPKPTM